MIRAFLIALMVLQFALHSIEAATPARNSIHHDPAGPVTIDWYDAALLPIEGRGWPQAEAPFVRLPARVETEVTEAVWRHSRCSTGLALRFASNSPRLFVRWSGGGAMKHMPATGVSGLDLYGRSGDDQPWTFLAVGIPDTSETTRTLHQTSVAVEQQYLLFLPLYAPTNYLEVGVEAGSDFRVLPPPPGKPIVFYGTSIVMGGCASRTGMAHPAILGRWLNREVVNLGFSGSAKMEPIIAELLGELDASVYVLDSLPNMVDELVEERYADFVRKLRAARPETPILIVEHLKPERVPERNAMLKRIFTELQAEGLGGLHYLEGEKLLAGEEEGTVDGIHPTDLGYFRLAEAHREPLSRILSAR
jgi:hypothetical protein